MKKIILVDDDLELCDELAELFRAEGYLVDNTSDSEQGASLIKKNRYDIGVLDYKMKGLNGIDLLKMIKKVNPKCAVFIVSGRPAIDELIVKTNVAGLVAGVITKPFRIKELLGKIGTVK